MKFVYYINSKAKPFIVSCRTKRHNFSTVQIVFDHISGRILCFYDGEKRKSIEYRQERYIQKGSKISYKIKKVDQPNFLSLATKETLK